VSLPPPKAKGAPARPTLASDPPPELFGALVTSDSIEATRQGSSGEATRQGSSSAAGEPIELGEDDLEEIHEQEVADEPPVPSVEPVSPRMAVAEAPKPASAHKDPAAPTVLVVEDDASIRAMIIRALGLSYTVFEADDGVSAMEILARIPPPACIVSDWMMPRMDGLELAKRVRSDKALKWTPLILLTAKNHPLDVVQGINAGARHYLAKPFKMKELLDKVGSVLGPKK
jgi:CheY-like chemotaxis protein